MSNHVMQATFADSLVRCETENMMISLNDLLIAGNNLRKEQNLPHKNLMDIRGTKGYAEFRTAVAKRIGVPEESLEHKVRGRNGRTMANLYLAVYVAEQLSPDFHVEVIRTFIEGRLLEMRELGGVMFTKLNTALNKAMVEWEDREAHKGHYVAVSRAIKSKIVGDENSWDNASVQQTQLRYEYEDLLVNMLKLKVIRDWAHFKEVIANLESSAPKE